MKKKYRIKSEIDFKHIFKQKQSKANKQFVIYYTEKDNQEHIRVGLSVSKKLGKAVLRNQIKRKIRRAFHELDGVFKHNYDIIVIARLPVVTMNIEEIKKSLLHVMNLCQIVE